VWSTHPKGSGALRGAQRAATRESAVTETLRQLSFAPLLVVGVVFAGAPLQTFGQRWRSVRWGPRNVVIAVELSLYALWALARFRFHLDAPLSAPRIEPAIAMIGALLAYAGATLMVWAKLRLGRWFSFAFGVKEGHELVTDGPYAITRHPIYTGIVTTILGEAMVWNSALTLALAACIGASLYMHTVYEERLFDAHFGPAYDTYRRRVPRMLPLPRPARAGR